VPLRNAVSSASAGEEVNQDRASACGNSCGSFSKNAMSVPMMQQTGAAIVLSRLPEESAGFSLSLPSGVVTKTNRAGEQLAEVGPWRRIS
jgi:hypothetical protein